MYSKSCFYSFMRFVTFINLLKLRCETFLGVFRTEFFGKLLLPIIKRFVIKVPVKLLFSWYKLLGFDHDRKLSITVSNAASSNCHHKNDFFFSSPKFYKNKCHNFNINNFMEY